MLSMRKVKLLERAIDELFNSESLLLHEEVLVGIYLNMMIDSVEDENQPMLSYDEIKDTLLSGNVPVNLKLAVKKQLQEQGFIDDELIQKLTDFVKGEI